jgi:hypothetical protein
MIDAFQSRLVMCPSQADFHAALADNPPPQIALAAE